MRRRCATLALAFALSLTACGTTGPVDAGRAILNTSWTCDALNEVLANSARTFGDDLAAMADHRAAGDPAGAEASRTAAQGAIAGLARDLRLAAYGTNDPVLVAAVAQASDNLIHLALDQSLLLGLRSFTDLVTVVHVVTIALHPLSAICD